MNPEQRANSAYPAFSECLGGIISPSPFQNAMQPYRCIKRKD
jgi:hypothetical protein